MVIGFIQSFGYKKTEADHNLKNSFKSLRDADIFVYNKIEGTKKDMYGFFVVSETSLNSVGNSRNIFQTLLYQCLIVVPVSQCRVPLQSGETAQIYGIVSSFVNHIVKLCTDDSNESGEITMETVQNWSETCFPKAIGILRDNKESVSLKLDLDKFAKDCLEKSLQRAKTVGKPKVPNNPSVAGWNVYNDKWKHISNVECPKKNVYTRYKKIKKNYSFKKQP